MGDRSGLALIGDIHAEWQWLDKIVNQIPEGWETLQVGDFGIWPSMHAGWEASTARHHTPWMHFIDGNHEYFPYLPVDARGPHTVVKGPHIWHGLKYIPRGRIIELCGYRILCFGGGVSIDQKRRKEGVSWFPEEVPSPEQLQRALDAAQTGVDLVVTHTPPLSITDAFNGLHGTHTLQSWGYPLGWRDPVGQMVEQIWQASGCKPLYCGHFHRSYRHRGVTILGINEVVMLPHKEDAGRGNEQAAQTAVGQGPEVGAV